jgi:hypothetical protein
MYSNHSIASVDPAPVFPADDAEHAATIGGARSSCRWQQARERTKQGEYYACYHAQ